MPPWWQLLHWLLKKGDYISSQLQRIPSRLSGSLPSLQVVVYLPFLMVRVVSQKSRLAALAQPIVLVTWGLGQEDLKFKASLGYGVSLRLAQAYL